MRYLTYSELIFINGRLLNDVGIQSGTQKIRDIDLLLASEQRPQASAFGADAYPTLHEKAGALLHSLARNHPFRDGNKRTAVLSAILMLAVNGEQVMWDAQEALDIVLAMAQGQRDVRHFVAWLHTIPTDAHAEPDLTRDTQHIDELIVQHQWLLDELARQ